MEKILEYATGIFHSNSEYDTMQLALRFSRHLSGNEIILLNGELGAGKTTFVKGLARGIEVNSIVKSPTFVIIKTYEGRMKLTHIDMYRLEPEEIPGLGLEDLIDGDSIIVVEWNKYEEFNRKANFIIEIIKENESSRKIEITQPHMKKML